MPLMTNVYFYVVGPRGQGPSTFAGSSVASVEPEVIPESISSKSDHSHKNFLAVPLPNHHQPIAMLVLS